MSGERPRAVWRNVEEDVSELLQCLSVEKCSLVRHEPELNNVLAVLAVLAANRQRKIHNPASVYSPQSILWMWPVQTTPSTGGLTSTNTIYDCERHCDKAHGPCLFSVRSPLGASREGPLPDAKHGERVLIKAETVAHLHASASGDFPCTLVFCSVPMYHVPCTMYIHPTCIPRPRLFARPTA